MRTVAPQTEKATTMENLYASKSPEEFLMLEEESVPESRAQAWKKAAMHMHQKGYADGRDDARWCETDKNDYLDGYNAAIAYVKANPSVIKEEEVPDPLPTKSMLDRYGKIVHIGDKVKYQLGISHSGQGYVSNIYVDMNGTPRLNLDNCNYNLPSESVVLVA